MKKLEEKDFDRILNYLREHKTECIYLTIDLEKYGTKSPQVDFWYNETDGEPDTVLMKYYDSFQIFSANPNWNVEEAAEWIAQYEVTTICGKESMIRALSEKLSDYTPAYGVVVKQDTFREFRQFENIRSALPEDAMEIARLMCLDEEFDENYKLEVLAEQLADRMKEGVGRSYVMREDGRIVAHVSVFAENSDMAVVSGLIVAPEYAGKFYGMIIYEYVKMQLMQEGKTVYGFRIKDSMKRCAKAENGAVCGGYGKLTRRNKENER